MISILPDLTPRDSHSLWYTSSRTPNRPNPQDGHQQPGQQQQQQQHDGANNGNGHHHQHHGRGPAGGRAGHAAALERSGLARLRVDEALLERRRVNVANFGAQWLKPPGIGKTLFQMREEQREAEEHAEAVRREQLQQELAEAEAEAAMEAAGGGPGGGGGVDLDGDGGPGGEPMDEDGEGGGPRDLDDDIPDADEGGFGYDGASDDDDENEDSRDDEDDDSAGSEAGAGTGAAPGQVRAQRRELQHQLATVRAIEDRVRQMAARGAGDAGGGTDPYSGDELDEAEAGQLLDEEDLGHEVGDDLDGSMGMDMDADLDGDIPDAESGGYEHTDTEAELDSSDEDLQNESFAPPRASQPARFRGSLAQSVRSDGTRQSIDISSILSRDGSSSMMGSSPQMRRRN